MKSWLVVVTCMLLLTGCWDQNLLKDVKLVMGAGFDLTPDGKIMNTVSTPLFKSTPGGVEIEKSQIVTAVGNTSRDARDKLDNKVSERFDASKLMVVALGKTYAQKDIYPAFDVLYRNPVSSLLASVIVVDGNASELFKVNTEEKKEISQYLLDYIRSVEDSSFIPSQANPMMTDLFDPGIDLALPLVGTKPNQIELKGLAMFNNNRYTGTYLTPHESMLFLLMSNKMGKKASINLKIFENKKPKMNNYITLNITNVNRDLNITADKPNEVSAKLNLTLKVEVIEYPENNLSSLKTMNKLNKKLSQVLSQEANRVLKKTQNADSDILGIGRHIRAFHNNTWKKMNWHRDYPKINMTADVKAKIVKHGIFN